MPSSLICLNWPLQLICLDQDILVVSAFNPLSTLCFFFACLTSEATVLFFLLVGALSDCARVMQCKCSVKMSVRWPGQKGIGDRRSREAGVRVN